MRYFVTLDGEELPVDVVERPGGQLEVSVAGEPVAVDVVKSDGAINVRVGQRVFDLWLEGDDAELTFAAGSRRGSARVQSEQTRVAERASRPAGGGEVRAPMPGRVVKVLVAAGAEVDAGDPVIVVEAMKMENELVSDVTGVVRRILAAPGQTVDAGTMLVELGAPE